MRSATSSIPASRRSPLVAPSRLPKSSQVAQKGPDARRRGRRHPEAYSLYVERVPPPAPTKQLGLFQRRHPEAYSLYVERVPPPAPTKQLGLFQPPGRVAPTAATTKRGALSRRVGMSGRKRVSTNPAASNAPLHCSGVRKPPLGR